MFGARRALLLLVVAAFAASCAASGGPPKTAVAGRRLARTAPTALRTNIGDAATVDRGASRRVIDGLELVMQTNETATFARGASTHVILTVTNTTDHPIGYLTNRETHFALMNQANKVLWTDQRCTEGDHTGTLRPVFGAVAPGDHVAIEYDYPGGERCGVPAGDAFLTGGVTVCLNLSPDGACRGASDARVQATPIAVTIS